MMKYLLTAIALTLLVACATEQKIVEKDPELENVYQMMQGSYDSSLQASQDSTYYNISLEMHPVWESSKDKWLYVEQALASRKDKPYRVRMYRLTRINENEIASEVYTIPDEQEFYGKYKNPEAFKNLLPTDLEIRKGCEVILKKTGPNEYRGSTGKNTCSSSLRGASFASSLVIMNQNQIISWDRGYDADGNQVWGAEKGGYVFMKGSLRKLK